MGLMPQKPTSGHEYTNSIVLMQWLLRASKTTVEFTGFGRVQGFRGAIGHMGLKLSFVELQLFVILCMHDSVVLVWLQKFSFSYSFF